MGLAPVAGCFPIMTSAGASSSPVQSQCPFQTHTHAHTHTHTHAHTQHALGLPLLRSLSLSLSSFLVLPLFPASRCLSLFLLPPPLSATTNHGGSACQWPHPRVLCQTHAAVAAGDAAEAAARGRYLRRQPAPGAVCAGGLLCLAAHARPAARGCSRRRVDGRARGTGALCAAGKRKGKRGERGGERGRGNGNGETERQQRKGAAVGRG